MIYALLFSALINLNTLGVTQGNMGVEIVAEKTVEVVEVEHKQRGALLGLVPITFTVKAYADARGNVDVKYPWFSALTIDKQDEVKTKARIAVASALKASAVGSVRAEGESAEPRFTSREAEIVRSELIKVLDNTSADMEGMD